MFTKSIKKFVKQFLLQTPPALNLKNKNFSIDVKFYPYLDTNCCIKSTKACTLSKEHELYILARMPPTER